MINVYESSKYSINELKDFQNIHNYLNITRKYWYKTVQRVKRGPKCNIILSVQQEPYMI